MNTYPTSSRRRVGIAVRRGNDTFRLAFNWALFRLWEMGRFTDLRLRYAGA